MGHWLTERPPPKWPEGTPPRCNPKMGKDPRVSGLKRGNYEQLHTEAQLVWAKPGLVHRPSGKLAYTLEWHRMDPRCAPRRRKKSRAHVCRFIITRARSQACCIHRHEARPSTPTFGIPLVYAHGAPAPSSS